MVKKILLVRNAFYFDFGGGERIPVELAAQLQRLDYQPVVVSRSQKLLDYAKSKNIPTIRGWWWSSQIWTGKRKLLFPLYFIWLFLLFFWYIFLIARTRSDVVHPQSRDDFIAATIAGKLLRKRVVWTDHADLKYIYRNNRVWYKNPIGKIIYRLSKHVRAVIIVSKNELGHIHENLGHEPPENYRVIYNGVDSEEVPRYPRNEEDKNAVIFAATSRLVTAKGINELITAFNEISGEHTEARLWLFGEGPEEAMFKKLAGNNEHIVFWGFPEDSLSKLSAADVFVHPSYHEGFSVSLIEAAKLGLPIIACDVGGNPELVEPNINGILVPPRDHVSLANAMLQLLGDKNKRIKYGKSARKTFEDKLVFEKIVKEQMAPLYE